MQNIRAEDIPLPPDDRSCSGGCGKVLKAEWMPSVINTALTAIGKPGIYVFPDPCEACTKRIDEREAAALAEEEAKERRIKLVALLGGERGVDDFTFPKYVPKTESQTAALEECRNFAPGASSLYLWGTTGGGKTHLSCALAAAAFNAGLRVEFWKTGPLLRYIRMKEPDIQEKIIKRWVTADLFVLDDLGIGKTSDFSASIFYDIVDARFMAKRHGLVVTSNLSLDAMAKNLDDDRLPSRIAGLCKGNIIEVKGPDGRLQ